MEYGFTSFHIFLTKNGVVMGNAVKTSGGGGSFSDDSGRLTIKDPESSWSLYARGLLKFSLFKFWNSCR